ncbi:MAG: DMT family transporter [Campylobacterales bacterium]|nr:DMT family transporter [Campylobacterales bacterium]
MSNERKGEWYMVLLALFESWFPIVIIFAYAYIEPIFAYAINGIIAAAFFVGVILYKKSFGEYRNRQGYRDLFLTAFYITLLFVFVFVGLKFTSASNMAVILFMQLFFSFLYFNVIGSQPMNKIHLLGAVLMGVGAVVLLFPKELNFNIGDTLVLLAAMIAPIANYYQKRSRQYYSSHFILAFRYIVSLPFLLLLAFVFEPMPTYQALLLSLPYLLVSGLLVMGVSKIFWVEAIYLISITKASALAALSPVLTIFFAYLFLDEVPTLMQLIAIVPILVGGYMITRPLVSKS